MDKALRKEQFEEYLSLAERLSDKLSGESHIISRRKLRENNGFYTNKSSDIYFFQTFHSLAAKILPKYSIIETPQEVNKKKLGGDEMFKSVENALELYNIINDTDKDEVKDYYYAIRMYENGYDQSLLELEAGFEVYDLYLMFMEKKLDWEESIRLATYYLDFDLITSVKKLPNRYIIVDADVLLGDSNSNITNFLVAFYKWNVRNQKQINIYFLKNNKNLTPFINGNQTKEIHIEKILSK